MDVFGKILKTVIKILRDSLEFFRLYYIDVSAKMTSLQHLQQATETCLYKCHCIKKFIEKNRKENIHIFYVFFKMTNETKQNNVVKSLCIYDMF